MAILKMELKTTILLHANSEVILWDWDNLVKRSRGMTGAELVARHQDQQPFS
jgi:hypothetical protein